MPYDKIDKKDLWIQAAKTAQEMDKAMVGYKQILANEIQGGINEIVCEPADEEQVVVNIEAANPIYPPGFLKKLGVQEEPEAELSERERRFLANRQEDMLVYYPRNNPGDGYADHTIALDSLHYFNLQDLLARFFIGAHANYGKIENWRQHVVGCTSMYFGNVPKAYNGGTHMPMFDYDGKNVKKIIRKDVKMLQKEYELGDAWVYETRRGFHVYFFCDMVGGHAYKEMLDRVQCCKGFKRAFRGRSYSVLRVSAKYTDFDIVPLYVLPAKDGKLRRMTRKAHTIRGLIELGQECGTHLAVMYPQWAHFQQDMKEWKPPAKRPKAKRIRKMSKAEHAKYQAQKKAMYKDVYGKYGDGLNVKSNQAQYIVSTDTSTTATINFSNTWVSNNGGGTGGDPF